MAGNDARSLSRRRLLALSAGGLAAGVAGCAGSDDGLPAGDDTETSAVGDGAGRGESGESGAEPVNAAPTSAVSSRPGDINFNRYASNIEFSNLLWDYLQKNYLDGETFDWLLDEFTYDKRDLEYTYRFKEGFYWHNGDPVTARDYYNQQEIDRLMDPEGSEIASHELVDDYTVRAKRKGKLNPILVDVEANRLWTRRDYNAQWLEEYRDASSGDERDAVTSRLTEEEIPIDRFAEMGMANSTFRLSDWSDQRYVFEVFDDHPFAEDVTVDEMRFEVLPDQKARNRAVVEDRLDWGVGKFPRDVRESAPDHLQTLNNTRDINSRTLVFNFENEHVGRRGVRRALVAVLDFEELAAQTEHQFVKRHQSGLPRNLERRWLGQEFLDELIPYSPGSSEEQAARFLQREGYSRSGGGAWTDEDDNTIDFTLSFPASSFYSTYGKAIRRQLNEFGFEAQFDTKDGRAWYQDFLDAEGWDVVPFAHGWSSNEPLNFFDYDNQYKMRLGPNGEAIAGWLDEGKTTSPLNGKPLVVDLPTEVGALDTSRGSERVNLYRTIENLKVAQTDESTAEITKTLSWYFNYDLPLVDTFPGENACWGDTEEFAWPSKDHSVWHQTHGRPTSQWRRGLVDGVSKQS